MDNFQINNILIKNASELPDDVGLLFQSGKLTGIVNIISDQYHVFEGADPDTLYGSDGFMRLLKDKQEAA